MIVLIAGPTLLIYVLILGLAGTSLYRQSKAEAERAMTRLAANYSARLDTHLREASRVAETAARAMTFADRLSDEEIYELLERNVSQLPLVYGAAIAFEPGTRKPAGQLFAPYVCRSQSGLRRVNIDRSVYDWYGDPRYTWYSEPKRLGRGVWSAPYFDEGAGSILMSTYSAPFFRDGNVAGVCTVDIDLPNMRESVGREIHQTLDFVILDADGRFVFHPDPTRIMARTVLDYATDSGQVGLASIVSNMLSGNSGSAWIEAWDDDREIGVFYSPVRSTGWVFACRMPQSEVLEGAQRQLLLGASALVAALLLTALCIYVVAGRISAPIVGLKEKVLQVSKGNLDARSDEAAATDELRTLASSFNQMTADLRGHVDRLAIEQSARQRIERDLDIAREIQRGLLPATTLELSGYEIAGWSKPAEKTGGDYYDWIAHPDGPVLISLADVSGHGVGPALVTAVCRAYARAGFNSGQNLDALLGRLNDLLFADLPRGRFVTYAALLLDPQTHRAQYISAGHGPSFRFILSRNSLVECESAEMPLGIVENTEFAPPMEFSFEPGDSILLVTDGLFEWANESGELYGLPRLRQAIKDLAKAQPADMIKGLYDRALAFAGHARQEDDITMVVLRRT